MSSSILFPFIRCVCTGRVQPVVSGGLYPIRGTMYPIRGTMYPIRGTMYPIRGTMHPIRDTCLAGCDRPYPPLTDTSR
jgi:hypothetical protein